VRQGEKGGLRRVLDLRYWRRPSDLRCSRGLNPPVSSSAICRCWLVRLESEGRVGPRRVLESSLIASVGPLEAGRRN
jgi:hypothetical protein